MSNYWKLCLEFIDRHRNHLSEEQVFAQAHSFARSQLQLRGDADQIPVGNGIIPTGEMETSCWERQAEPESPQSSPVVEVTEKVFKKEEVKFLDEHAPMEETSSCSFKPSKVKLNDEISKLTYFKPVETIRKTKEIYRNLVILDDDFNKTQAEFDKLGLGRLLVTGETCDEDYCRGVVAVKTSEKLFPLAQAVDSTVKKARHKAEKIFLKEMKQVCYQVVSKQLFFPPEKHVARRGDLATNIEYYMSIMGNFSKQSIKQELTFSKKFSQEERHGLKRIARELGLTTCTVGPQGKRRLKIMGESIPALAVVERIVVQKDPELCELYEVLPPMLRRECKSAPSHGVLQFD